MKNTTVWKKSFVKMFAGLSGTTICLAAIFSFAQIALADPSGLVGKWPGGGNANDVVGGDHGTLVNGVTFAPGEIGSAFSFNGQTQYVSIPDTLALRPASITVEAWINFTSLSGLIMGKPYQSADNNSWALGLWGDGTLRAFIHDSGNAGIFVQYSFNPVFGRWYHVAFTFDDTTKVQALYIDGVLVASDISSRSIGYDSNPVTIGGDLDYGAPDFSYTGQIDEAAIFNRALTAGEIASIYAAGLGVGTQMSTAITYQGRLNSGGTPASGNYDLAFTLFATNTSGVAIGGPVTNSAVAVANGLFTTQLDFGSAFNGAETWLEIAVSPAGANTFTTLTPRQPVTPTPYALFAATAANATTAAIASTANSVAATNITGMIANNNLPANANFSGTVTAGTVNVTNLNLPGAGLIYSGANTLLAHYDGNLLAGFYAGNTNITGSFGHSGDNVAVGDYSLTANVLGYWNTAVGYYAMNNNYFGAQNTAVGAGSLQNNTHGGQITAVGFQALFSNDSASQNTAVGFQALFANNSGANNTAVGYQALDNDLGAQNTAVGSEAMLSKVNGDNDTMVGFAAGYKSGGSDNTAVGESSMFQNTGSSDTAMGENTLQNNSGIYDAALGNNALQSNGSGSYNTAIGANAMVVNSTGSYNTALGYRSLYFSTGDNNIALGYQAGQNINGANNIDIGNQGVAGENATIRIGDPNVHTATYLAGVIYGIGSGLTNLPASQIVGTISSAQIGGLYANSVTFTNSTNYFTGTFTGNGGGLTGVPAAAVSGTLPASQLSGTVQSAQISGTYANPVTFLSGGNNFAGAFTGSGAALTGLNGSQITNGTVADARLSTNVALLNGNQTFTGTNTFVGTIIFTGTNAFSVNTNALDAGTLISGTLPDARLSGNVPRLNANQTFTGTNTFAGVVNLPGLRLQSNASTNDSLNVIAGSSVNYVSNGVVGAVISGGGATNYFGAAYTNSVTGDFGTVGGGVANSAGNSATVGGGYLDIASGTNATVGGGSDNAANNYSTTVGGGVGNRASGASSTVGGGFGNTASSSIATVGGGGANTAGGGDATVAGGYDNGAIGEDATVGGGYGNYAGGDESTVGGGSGNGAYDNSATVGGGHANFAENQNATVGGGGDNTANGDNATVGGGQNNYAGNSSATVSGGSGNTATGAGSLVGGGTNNAASGLFSTVSGGNGNAAGGQYAIVSGGHANSAGGDFSFAGGNHASAPFQGDFVWADDNGGNFAATANNQFFVRAGGGVYFYSGSGSTGVALASGSGSWSNLSDRNAKENFQPVDAQTVLTAVTAMPMTTWNYKTQARTIRHVGPMAQDFATAFHVGENDTSISTVDEGGVALAAIQGLNQKVEAKETRIKEQESKIQNQGTEIADLKSRLEKLEQLLAVKTGDPK